MYTTFVLALLRTSAHLCQALLYVDSSYFVTSCLSVQGHLHVLQLLLAAMWSASMQLSCPSCPAVLLNCCLLHHCFSADRVLCASGSTAVMLRHLISGHQLALLQDYALCSFAVITHRLSICRQSGAANGSSDSTVSSAGASQTALPLHQELSNILGMLSYLVCVVHLHLTIFSKLEACKVESRA